jgi:hypothetical protein
MRKCTREPYINPQITVLLRLLSERNTSVKLAEKMDHIISGRKREGKYKEREREKRERGRETKGKEEENDNDDSRADAITIKVR